MLHLAFEPLRLSMLPWWAAGYPVEHATAKGIAPPLRHEVLAGDEHHVPLAILPRDVPAPTAPQPRHVKPQCRSEDPNRASVLLTRDRRTRRSPCAGRACRTRSRCGSRRLLRTPRRPAAPAMCRGAAAQNSSYLTFPRKQMPWLSRRDWLGNPAAAASCLTCTYSMQAPLVCVSLRRCHCF